METDDFYIVKYNKEIVCLKSLLLDDLSKIDIHSILVYGSAVNKQLFDEKYSDVDILAFTDHIRRENIECVLSNINNLSIDFGDKMPVYIEDYVSPRIEFVYQITSELKFDISLLPTQLTDQLKIERSILRDNTDIIIGGMYLHSIPLYGKFPNEDDIRDYFLPFYREVSRTRRLLTLRERIEGLLYRIEDTLNCSQTSSNFACLEKIHPYVMRYIFILYRYYPVSISKHLEVQLRECGIQDEQIRMLLFQGGSGYKDTVQYFVSVVKDILNDTTM